MLKLRFDRLRGIGFPVSLQNRSQLVAANTKKRASSNTNATTASFIATLPAEQQSKPAPTVHAKDRHTVPEEEDDATTEAEDDDATTLDGNEEESADGGDIPSDKTHDNDDEKMSMESAGPSCQNTEFAAGEAETSCPPDEIMSTTAEHAPRKASTSGDESVVDTLPTADLHQTESATLRNHTLVQWV